MTDAKRAELIKDAFGGEGASAPLAIFQQLTDGIKTTSGELVKAGDAVDYLRQNMDEAGGSADKMAKLQLKTLTGQLKLLGGSVKTLAIEVGEAFAPLTRGPVKLFIDGVNKIIELFKSLPAPVRKVLAGLAALTGVSIMIAGGILILQSVMAMFGITLSSIALSLLSIIVLAGVFTAAIATIGIGIFGIVRALRKNAGGAGDSFQEMFRKVKLGFKGVIELFRGGTLSSEMTKELKKSENEGVLKFVRSFERWLIKARAFFDGFIQGFDDGLARMEPAISRLKQTFLGLFGTWTKGTDKGASGTGKWIDKGKRFGDVLADVSTKMIELATDAINVGAKIAKAFSGVTIDDVTTGVTGLLAVMKGLAKAVETVYNFFTLIWSAIEGIGYALAAVVSSFIQIHMTGKDIVDAGLALITGDTKGAKHQLDIAKEELGLFFGGGAGGSKTAAKRGPSKAQAVKSLEARQSAIADKLLAIRGGQTPEGETASQATDRLTQEFQRLSAHLIKINATAKPLQLFMDGQELKTRLDQKHDDEMDALLGLPAQSVFSG
jgi:hypothetical protein